ncbi:MAG: NAD(P)/FAD-dependent oxidoreductase [Pseudomonadota bacterium]
MSGTLHTIIIGAGQAGLCASYYLSQQGIEHIILERARIGERWRSERWDSLRFQFPNRYVYLPGFPYEGDDPEAFMHRDGIIDVLDRYAQHIEAPVLCGVNVEGIERDAQGVFVLQAGRRYFRARNVVVATGPYQYTRIPELADALPQRLRQLPASAYTHSAALPAGAVLVVGAGGSGVQIVEDLLAAGRDTYLCVGNFKRIPRTYRGRDIMDWFEELNLTSQVATNRDPSDHSPLLTGVDGGYEVDLRRVVAEGGTLLGRLEGVAGEEIQLGDRLLQHMAAAEQAYDDLVGGIEAALAASGAAADEAPAKPPAPGPMPPTPPTRLNLEAHNIQTVVWATGYGVDFSWIDCGAYLGDGMPVQTRGVSEVPGLYFLGMAFLHSARSSFFWGVGEDAEHVVQHVVQRSS